MFWYPINLSWKALASSQYLLFYAGILLYLLAVLFVWRINLKITPIVYLYKKFFRQEGMEGLQRQYPLLYYFFQGMEQFQIYHFLRQAPYLEVLLPQDSF